MCVVMISSSTGSNTLRILIWIIAKTQITQWVIRKPKKADKDKGKDKDIDNDYRYIYIYKSLRDTFVSQRLMC